MTTNMESAVFVAIPVPVNALIVGQYIYGDGPYAEFKGGVIKAIIPHPNWTNCLQITIEQDNYSSSQGWLKSTQNWVADSSLMVTVAIPLEDWERMVDA